MAPAHREAVGCSTEPFGGPPAGTCDGCGAEALWLVHLVFGPLAGRRLCAACLPPPVRMSAIVPCVGAPGQRDGVLGSPWAGDILPSAGTKFHEED